MNQLAERTVASELQQMYDQVPGTCCASSGECCELTDVEMTEGYATMFPLYRAEYANIVRYVQKKFSPERQREVFAHFEERPRRCPFLDPKQRCTIYPVRPLICRTYAVMNQTTIVEAVKRHRGKMPDRWLRGFSMREGGMVCPRVMVTQPEKLARHAQNLITSAYERTLSKLSRKLELIEGERRKTVRKLIGSRLPERWSWGGFNVVKFAPLEWIQSNLKEYWKKTELADP